MSQAFELKPNKLRDFQQILDRIVKETRRILKCERVVVCDAVELPTTKILAESVVAEEVAVLGRVITDPFLAGEYLEMYCYGMSLTIDNIYTAEITPQDLQDLKNLGITSLAVAPIYVAKQLVGFLTAHRHSFQKPWDLAAIDLLADRASAIGAALAELDEAELAGEQDNCSTSPASPEIIIDAVPQVSVPKSSATKVEPATAESAANSQSEKSNVELQLTPVPQQKIEDKHTIVKSIRREITRGRELTSIFQSATIAVRQLLECDRVLIFSFVELPGRVVAEAVATGCVKTEFLSYVEEDRNGKIRSWTDTQSEDLPGWYEQQLEALNVKAGLVAPIASQGRLLGLLVAHHCSENRVWHEQETAWITDISNDIGTMVEQITNANQQSSQLDELQQQLAKEKMWTRYFANVIHKIRQSLKTEDILNTTVEQIHDILKCDRALVYALNQDSYGEVVAESVSPGWTKARGKVIQDPCFAARYLEKYRDGRFRVWNNIYEAGMTGCHIEQLERLEVRANVVVPILNEDKLFGLLVVQQCSNSRQWQQSEILWLTQIAAQVGFALGNAQLLADARQLRQQSENEKKWTEYFTEAVQQIRQSLQTQEIYQASVREVRRVLNCDRVLVYSLNQDRYGTIVAESVARGWTSGAGRVIQDPCFEVRYLDKYRDGRVRVWPDIYQAETAACYLEQLESLEVRANLVVPIVSQNKLFGLLVAHECSGPRQWQQVEIDWLTQIAVQVSFALENAQLRTEIAEHSQVARKILDRAAVNSSNIQRTVENVTREFDRLDRSCADFSATIQQMKGLGKQLAQQSMGMTRAVNLSTDSSESQATVAEMSERIFTLMQELFETSAKIDPLFDSIRTEIAVKTETLESETNALVEGTTEFQTVRHKLDEIVTLNSELSNLIENTSASLDTQIKSLNFAQDSAGELTDITERISQQSVALFDSFAQLGRIIA